MGIKVMKFSSTWCGPCKVLAPIFDKISNMEDFKDIDFFAYDIENDENGVELVEQYQIRNIPTIVIANEDGYPIKKIIGLVGETEIINLIKEEMKKHGL